MLLNELMNLDEHLDGDINRKMEFIKETLQERIHGIQVSELQ